MGSGIELVSDGDGLAVIGASADVERFFLSAGLDRLPSKQLDLHRLWAASGTGGAATQIAADLAGELRALGQTDCRVCRGREEVRVDADKDSGRQPRDGRRAR